MDGLSRTAGIGPVVTIGGRRLTVSGKRLRHYAEIEANVLALRGSPFDLIRQMSDALRAPAADSHPLPIEIVTQIVTQAFIEARTWRMVTLGEALNWLEGTFQGRCFRTWLAVRDNNPQALTLDAVTEMYADEYERILREKGDLAAEQWDTVIARAIENAEGDDELGNSNTSPPGGTVAETTSPSRGTSSSESSTTNADGTKIAS